MRSAAVRSGVEAESIDGATETGVGPTCAYSMANVFLEQKKRQSRFLSGTCLRECNPTLVRLATYVPADSGTGLKNFHHRRYRVRKRKYGRRCSQPRRTGGVNLGRQLPRNKMCLVTLVKYLVSTRVVAGESTIPNQSSQVMEIKTLTVAQHDH